MKIQFDFSEIEIGMAQSEHGDTGCTVIKVPRGSLGAVDIRGGAAAVRESSNLEDISSDVSVDGIVLAGGSTYGLEAASGVMTELLKERKQSTQFIDIPCVPSAIVYDFRFRKDNSVYPSREMGQEAYHRRQCNQLEIGAVGAGSNIYVGKFDDRWKMEKSGQGAHFLQLNGIKVLAITVVNSVGNILNAKGEVSKGSIDSNGQRHSFQDSLNFETASKNVTSGNTTISLLITNVQLSREALKRIAIMTHTSMAKNIEPFHTPWDGDVLFAVSTQKQKLEAARLEFQVGLLGIEAMQKAILSLL